jgi:hypothetical protein
MSRYTSCLVGALSLTTAAAAIGSCETKGTYVNEKGGFAMSWCFPSEEDIQITFQLAGTAFVGIGFGGSMYEADIVSGWVDAAGAPTIKDYYSTEEGAPKEDTSLGGTDDVVAISGTRGGAKGANGTASSEFTELTFQRKLSTGDEFDTVISLTEPNDMIYAWGSADSQGLIYHGDNHNHVYIDFGKEDGIPDSVFGREESGELSREIVMSSFYGTLSTIQSEGAGNPGIVNYPYGSVADIADEEPSSGRPLLLLSDLERNVENMKTNPLVSLHLITLPETIAQFTHPEHYDIMTKPRTTLMGQLEKVPEDELEAAKATYLKKHPSSQVSHAPPPPLPLPLLLVIIVYTYLYTYIYAYIYTYLYIYLYAPRPGSTSPTLPCTAWWWRTCTWWAASATTTTSAGSLPSSTSPSTCKCSKERERALYCCCIASRPCIATQS